MQCDSFVFGTQCQPMCLNWYDLTIDGIADIYSCRDGKWIPEPKPISCPGNAQNVGGDQSTKLKVKSRICNASFAYPQSQS